MMNMQFWIIYLNFFLLVGEEKSGQTIGNHKKKQVCGSKNVECKNANDDKVKRYAIPFRKI